MIKQVVFATGYPEFENKVIEYANEQQDRDKFVLAHSATHLDNIVERCAGIRPSVLVIREGQGNEKVDFLEIIRQLVTRITNLHIVVITHKRQVGDPLITGLIMYNVYDFIVSDELSPADVGNLIIHPRSIQDIQHYLPKVNLKNNGNQLAFSASNEDDGNLSDINTHNTEELTDITSDFQSVAHVNQLDEVTHSSDDKSLYKQANKKTGETPSLVNIGSKLSYNPLFTTTKDVSEAQAKIQPTSFSMPKLHVMPKIEEVKVEQKEFKTPLQAEPLTSEEATVETKEETLDNEQVVDNTPKTEETVIEETAETTDVEKTTNEDISLPKEEHNEKQSKPEKRSFNSFLSWYNNTELDKQLTTLNFVLSRINPMELKSNEEMDEYSKIYTLYKDTLAERRRRNKSGGGK